MVWLGSTDSSPLGQVIAMVSCFPDSWFLIAFGHLPAVMERSPQEHRRDASLGPL